jgi:hypothetical protein
VVTLLLLVGIGLLVTALATRSPSSSVRQTTNCLLRHPSQHPAGPRLQSCHHLASENEMGKAAAAAAAAAVSACGESLV